VDLAFHDAAHAVVPHPQRAQGGEMDAAGSGPEVDLTFGRDGPRRGQASAGAVGLDQLQPVYADPSLAPRDPCGSRQARSHVGSLQIQTVQPQVGPILPEAKSTHCVVAYQVGPGQGDGEADRVRFVRQSDGRRVEGAGQDAGRTQRRVHDHGTALGYDVRSSDVETGRVHVQELVRGLKHL
jgi:hypothetical protein